MEQIITCINCPVGCRMTIKLSDSGDLIEIKGNTCPRGASYARQECIQPERMITAVIPIQGSTIPLSVKTAQPVPKFMINSVMKELSCVQLSLPVSAGQIILHNVLGTGSDIIATRSLT